MTKYQATLIAGGFIIRETREWCYGDSGWQATPAAARDAHEAKKGGTS